MHGTDPVTPASIDAVSGCTRALAVSSLNDLRPHFPATGTVGGLRAFGDRLALRERHERPAIHAAARPHESTAAAIYDSLSLARLDALGMRWLPGIAHNLLAHPGADEDGARWLAFEAWSRRAAPPEKATAIARTRAALGSSLVARLGDLSSTLDAHDQFATAAASWARDAAPKLERILAGTAPPALPFPLRPSGNDIRRGRYARPGSQKRDEGNAARDDLGGGHTEPEEQWDVTGLSAGYRAYTTEYDRIVNAAALATRAELAQLRQTMEAELAATRAIVSRLAKRLMRALMAKQAREWRFDLDEGLLDSSRLAPFVASRGAARPFKQEFDSPFPSTAVTLLIDHSGSMRGRPMQIAAMTVEIFARVLERCGVRCEVLGFTTREWDGGEPARQWAANGYPENPGRLNALEHIVIKAADVPWRRARVSLGLFLRDEMLKENIDGEALVWAHGRLLARAERRRILVVISDGTPMDEATFAANGYDYLDDHLLSVVNGIETRSPVQLAAIGIGHDVSRFYRNATRISKIDDLGPALTNTLMALLGEP